MFLIHMSITPPLFFINTLFSPGEDHPSAVYLNTTKTPKLRKDAQRHTKTRKDTQRRAKTRKEVQRRGKPQRRDKDTRTAYLTNHALWTLFSQQLCTTTKQPFSCTSMRTISDSPFIYLKNCCSLAICYGVSL